MTLLQAPSSLSLPPGVELRSPVSRSQESVLTPAALAFLAELERALRPGCRTLRQRRQTVREHLQKGRGPVLPDPPARTRPGDWQVAPAPGDLQDLRVGVHCPAHRAFLIPALNSTASVVTADLAESLATTWEQVLEAHIDLCDAVRRTSYHRDPDTGRVERLCSSPAALAVRPRGPGDDEPGLRLDGGPVAAALFDAGLYLFHNAAALHLRGETPALVVAGVQVPQEAEWWAELCAGAENLLGLPRGTVRVILLQDEVTGTFELDDLLWELRERIVAVALHRPGYLASWLRCVGRAPERLLPDPQHLGPDSPFLTAWRQLVVRTAHNRGVRALGVRSARLPVKGDPFTNHSAMDAVCQQKRREACDGMDGAWVAHPDLVRFVREVFDAVFPPPMQHQMDLPRAIGPVAAADLLRAPGGVCSLSGLRRNLDLIVCWEEALFRGRGRVRIGHFLFGAADVELARQHVLQWLRLAARLDDGSTVDSELVERELRRALGRIRSDLGSDAFAAGSYQRAARSAQIQLGVHADR